MGQSTILAVRNITKTYPGVRALDDITLEFAQGEIHAIAGENGAGKSTLIKILTGAIRADRGEIEVEGIVHTGFSPHEAQFNLGIAAIYQEFNLVPELSVAENVFFGKELQKGLFLDTKQMHLETQAVLEKLGVAIAPGTLIKNLSVSYQQIVEIAKAVSQNVKILIMDEPSAPLTTNEVDYMFQLVRTLKAQGVTIIYISHRLSEVFELADRVTVLRDGKFIETLGTAATDRKELIALMVGRELGESYPERVSGSDEVLLEVNHLSTTACLKDVSFRLHKGEILGFGGLVGAGRTELARAIFGADQIENGEILIDRNAVINNTPSRAVEHGIALIPEDRKQHGILADMSIKNNISFSSLKHLLSFGLISGKAEQQLAASFKDKMRIATPDLERKVKNLSGGNQQKVVLSKWLATRCNVILFDEPTRGIDVGAKQEIYELIAQLAEEGKGIIFISSEMPELLGMSDRILVMREGEIVGEFQKGDATQRAILELASVE